ncbi:MAG: carbonic anhydrase [Alphaproteobacteria bacterium]
MQRLIDGYHRFRATQWPERRATFEVLARQGQSPPSLVIACSDSRVDPAMIFNAGPGEMFIVRNVANLVPPSQPDGNAHATSAAIEFAVRVLEVSDIIVMGHAMCGGIQALLKGVPLADNDFLKPWIEIAAPAKARVLASHHHDPQTACELEAVKLSLENLMTFPWIAQRVGAKRLTLTGATFDIRSGELDILQPDGTFKAV